MSKESMRAQLDKLGRPSKVILYVVGMLEEMKAEGLVEGGHITLSEKGDQYIAALREDGFEPTPEEIDWAVRAIQEDAMRAMEQEDEEYD